MTEIRTNIELRFMDWDCTVCIDRYYNGGAPAIMLRDSYTGEHIATATTNLGVMPKPGNVIIKVWSENEGIDEALVEAGVLGEQVAIHPAGMTCAIEYELTDQVMQIVEKENTAYVGHRTEK